jgi:hypothetical protein
MAIHISCSPAALLVIAQKAVAQEMDPEEPGIMPDLFTLTLKKMINLHQHFIPVKDSELLGWAINYDNKITVAGPLIGLTPAQVTDQKDKITVVIGALNKVIQKTTEKAEAVTAKNLARQNELQDVVDAMVACKRNSLFTENIGRELGVIASVVTPLKATLAPRITATSYPAGVEIRFKKRGQTGVHIFCRPKGGNGEWEQIAKETKSPYLDTRSLVVAGNPEAREYMAICFAGSEMVGQQSDIVSVAFAGQPNQ